MVKNIRENGGAVAFDTNFRIAGWSSREEAKAAIADIAPFVSIVLPTFEDEVDLYGIEGVDDCVAHWRDSGAEEIVVKAGPKGAYLGDGGWVPPPTVIDSPVDTTGAGDSFNGAYLAARLRGVPPRQAAEHSHDLAAQVLMSPGAILPRS